MNEDLYWALVKLAVFAGPIVIGIILFELVRYIYYRCRPARFECTKCLGKGYYNGISYSNDGRTEYARLEKCGKCRAHPFSLFP